MANFKNDLKMKTSSMISEEAFCLNETYLGKLQRDKLQIRYEGVVVNCEKKRQIREFFVVEINSSAFWADTITGTLYDGLGICMTSSQRTLIGKPKQSPSTVIQARTELLAA